MVQHHVHLLERLWLKKESGIAPLCLVGTSLQYGALAPKCCYCNYFAIIVEIVAF